MSRSRDIPMSPEARDLLRDWDGPYGGTPPFNRVAVSAFEPALEAAMAWNLAEIDQIVADESAPTFANTIEALERSGRALDRVLAVYGVWSSNVDSPEFQVVERTMAPRLAAFADAITQNPKLFARIAHVYDSRDSLSPEQRRLTWLHYTNFVRAGARLDDDARTRLSEVNQRLAALFTRFNQNVLADETHHRLLLEDEADLAGLPASLRDAAAAAAAAEGMEDRWIIRNTRSSMEPFLTFSSRRDLRERGWRIWTRRGDNGDDHDNNAIVTEILSLRAERAALLGYPTHAHWRLEHSMAGDPQRALELLDSVWARALARVREDIAELEMFARADGIEPPVRPWDYRYLAEKMRRARFDLDQSEVEAYLQFDNIRDAMFRVARRLFGFAFRRVDDVPVYHPDVAVYEVYDGDRGTHIGLWYFDPFARQGKRSGAWMSAFRVQERFDGDVHAIVSNNSNIVKGRPGSPILLSWDDALTLFHEFGHALHGLASSVSYPSLSGTAVPRDYVEFPSQLLEHWLYVPEILERFALHVETGEPMPPALAARIARAATFNEAFSTTEYLASALVDMHLHLATDLPIDPAEFEQRMLRRIDMPGEVVMRHRIPHFAHAFGADAYSASYYSYLWADVLTADAFGAFSEAGDPFDPDTARRLLEHVYSRGNTIDPADAYRQFRGRDPGIDALLEKRGLLPARSAQDRPAPRPGAQSAPERRSGSNVA